MGRPPTTKGCTSPGLWKTRSVPVPSQVCPRGGHHPLGSQPWPHNCEARSPQCLSPTGTLSSSGSSSTSLSAHCHQLLLHSACYPGSRPLASMGHTIAGGASLRPRRSTLQAVPLLHLHCGRIQPRFLLLHGDRGSQAGQPAFSLQWPHPPSRLSCVVHKRVSGSQGCSKLLGRPQTEPFRTLGCANQNTVLTKDPLFTGHSSSFHQNLLLGKLVRRDKLLPAHIPGTSGQADILPKTSPRRTSPALWGWWACTRPLQSSCSGSRGCVAI